MITEYKTKEAQESAIRVITGCINAIENEKGLPDKIGTGSVKHTVGIDKENRVVINCHKVFGKASAVHNENSTALYGNARAIGAF